jgi:proteasome assembly chaperone (PAC2) family protein
LFGFPYAVKFAGGHEEPLTSEDIRNDFYHAVIGETGLVIFLGNPLIQEASTLIRYADAFLDGSQLFGARRIVSVAGTYDEVPFGKERNVSATFSLPHMKEELDKYALSYTTRLRFHDHNSIINHRAEGRNIEFVRMSVRVPGYDRLADEKGPIFANPDYRAFYGVLRRIRHMLGIDLDLSDLGNKSVQSDGSMHDRIARLVTTNPGVRIYLERLEGRFTEHRFAEPVNLSPSIIYTLSELAGHLERPPS